MLLALTYRWGGLTGVFAQNNRKLHTRKHKYVNSAFKLCRIWFLFWFRSLSSLIPWCDFDVWYVCRRRILAWHNNDGLFLWYPAHISPQSGMCWTWCESKICQLSFLPYQTSWATLNFHAMASRLTNAFWASPENRNRWLHVTFIENC